MATCTGVTRVLAIVVLVTVQMVVGTNKAADSATEKSNDNEHLRELLGTLVNYQVSIYAAVNPGSIPTYHGELWCPRWWYFILLLVR